MTDDVAGGNEHDTSRQFFFDVNEIPGHTNAERLGDAPGAERYLDLLGRDLVTRTLVHSPRLCVFHETARPGERVKPHRHGTYQLNYILRGELVFGRRRVGPDMGFFTPDLLYSWRAATRAPNGSKSTRVYRRSSSTKGDADSIRRHWVAQGDCTARPTARHGARYRR
ncbi:cupin domain-containing protein [Actinomadura sp. CNU-125]|uniref:cupin domain-containing protein n=1 Tax=Actinomadura sp. CNU-125 TaxID=1904961 RepID=UPI0021CCF2E0|nr:hypothetical protein [Actinomadura sp. CNU-125]